jgi:hypothetical protein
VRFLAGGLAYGLIADSVASQTFFLLVRDMAGPAQAASSLWRILFVQVTQGRWRYTWATWRAGPPARYLVGLYAICNMADWRVADRRVAVLY